MKHILKKRIISVLMSFLLVFTWIPWMGMTAQAATYKNVTSLPTAAGSWLYSSNIYTVRSNITITASTGGNALCVAGGNTVVIDIAPGCTLTVYGGNGSARTPGGAGIYLPSSSNLIVTGGGRLVAYGGNSGTPENGGNSGSPSRGGYDNGNYSGVTFDSGTGGYGGYGGGGAGAGIGTPGGTGGARTSNTGSVAVTYQTDHGGYNGTSGYSGSASESMGRLWVLGDVTVSASAGTRYSDQGYAGGISYNARIYYHTNWAMYQALGAGGAGGGGGQGGTASSIGSGGSGGGGGGAGGGGGTYWYYYNSKPVYIPNGGGGGGGAAGQGGAANNGTAGAAAFYQYTFYDGTSSTSYRNYGYGIYPKGASGSGTYGGASQSYCSTTGGNGGSAGSKGSNGSVYKASAAVISGRGSDGTIEVLGEVASTITLDRGAGTGGTSSFTVNYGCAMANITIPTRSQYTFMGYYTSQNGSGTRYFDHRGVAQSRYYETSDRTLYAYWVQSQFNVTLNRQSGTGGTTSVITTGTDGTLPSSIIIPTREHYQFMGYYENSAGQGKQYYNALGAATGNKITTNTTIYAYWKASQYPITFDRQSGSGGTASAWTTGTDGTLPAITFPTRTGYDFQGYYSAAGGGGTQYYSSTGPVLARKLTGVANTLYAYFKEKTYTITYNMDGGTNAAGNPTTRTYGQNTVIADPTRTDYTFMGWQIDSGAQRYTSFSIPANNAGYAKNLTLTATWLKSTEASADIQIQGAVSNPEEIAASLQNVFEYIVPENNKGVTAEDMSGDKSVKLVLTVSQSSNQNDETSISDGAQGTALVFYDIKVTKTVTAAGSDPVATQLTEIPVPVTVKIPISGDLSGKASYAVYRVHGSETQKLPVEAAANGEYYNTENNEIVISTRKFSTYGIVGTETTFASDMTSGDFKTGNQALDVQGRVIETTPGKVYKLDITWGKMSFEYSMQQEWDPVTHMNTEGALNSWRTTGFDGENNKVKILNHSNDDVQVNLDVQSDISGVAMSLHIYNEDTAALAENFILNQAPEGAADEELVPCNAYLFLNGSPTNEWILDNKVTFTKAGLINITVQPQPEA